MCTSNKFNLNVIHWKNVQSYKTDYPNMLGQGCCQVAKVELVLMSLIIFLIEKKTLLSPCFFMEAIRKVTSSVIYNKSLLYWLFLRLVTIL